MSTTNSGGEPTTAAGTPSPWVENASALAVVLLATFLGICNVKDGNIVQQMQKAQADRNNMWLWFQARNLREEMYLTASDELMALASAFPPDSRGPIDSMAKKYHDKAVDQARKKEKQKADAEKNDSAYEQLNTIDDKFDICEAALALALAMMGVTALLKKGWLFFAALVPSAFGLFMGCAGFLGWQVPIEEIPLMGHLVKLIL